MTTLQSACATNWAVSMNPQVAPFGLLSLPASLPLTTIRYQPQSIKGKRSEATKKCPLLDPNKQIKEGKGRDCVM
eukprot:4784377-Amphidinium_carterae.1